VQEGFVESVVEFGPFEEELYSIYIPNPPLPDQIRDVIVRLDVLYAKVLKEYIRAKIVYENIEDMADEIIKSSKTQGSNSEARAAKAYEAARTAELGSLGQVNLLELRRCARARYLYLQDILKAIDKKHERLITIEGAYGIEAKLT